MSVITIDHIPNDVLGVIFTFAVRKVYMSILTNSKYKDTHACMVYKYKWLVDFIKTCKRWMQIGYKILNPSEYDCILLRRACRMGRIVLVRHLLSDQRVNPAEISYECLCNAIAADSVSITKMLLQDKRINVTDLTKNHLIHRCASDNAICVLNYLISGEVGLDPSVDGNGCLIEACRNGYYEIVKLLLKDERIHNIKESVEYCVSDDIHAKKIRRVTDVSKTSKGQAIRECIRGRRHDVLTLLLGDSRTKPTTDELRYACYSGDSYAVSRLVRMVDDPNEGEKTALIAAIMNLQYHCVVELLNDPRVDPAARNNEAIVEACYRGNQSIIVALIQTGKIDPTTRLFHLFKYTSNKDTRILVYILEDYRDKVIQMIKSDVLIRMVAEPHINNYDYKYFFNK